MGPDFWIFYFFTFPENCLYFKMRRKYNTTQKNMKQISIESLRVNLGFRLDKSYPYTLLPSVKFLQLEP
jgi:hypothetical protein